LIANHTIGGRIYGLRSSRDVTQLELSAALNISTSALRNIEYGNTAPRLETLEKLSDFFKVSMDYIVRGVQSDGDNLDMYRATGLNDTALAFLGEEIDRGKECGGLNEYITTLNALVSGGLLPLVWKLNELNNELAGIDGEMACVLCNTPKPQNIVEEMQLSKELEPLQERRDLLKLRYLRHVERVFNNLIDKGADE